MAGMRNLLWLSIGPDLQKLLNIHLDKNIQNYFNNSIKNPQAEEDKISCFIA